MLDFRNRNKHLYLARKKQHGSCEQISSFNDDNLRAKNFLKASVFLCFKSTRWWNPPQRGGPIRWCSGRLKDRWDVNSRWKLTEQSPPNRGHWMFGRGLRISFPVCWDNSWNIINKFKERLRLNCSRINKLTSSQDMLYSAKTVRQRAAILKEQTSRKTNKKQAPAILINDGKTNLIKPQA